MRVWVLGGRGMLGRAVAAEFRARGAEVTASGHDEADITDASRLLALAGELRPHWIVNCAAMTNVDACETDSDLAVAVNDLAVANVAAAAEACGARLAHVSTDYVFDGTGTRPYREHDATGPLSVYGSSKLGGERRALALPGALVVRVSWLFGEGGRNFARTIAERVPQGEALRVVADQVGCPTHTGSTARAICDLAAVGASGVVHYRDAPSISWHGFATAIVRALGSNLEVAAIETGEMPRPARRPAYSVLDVSKFEALTGRPVEHWSDGLRSYLLHEEAVRT
jgi:dTDP-4-dehydrorhamnose reductase